MNEISEKIEVEKQEQMEKLKLKEFEELER